MANFSAPMTTRNWTIAICRSQLTLDAKLAFDDVCTWVEGPRGLVVCFVGLPAHRSISLTADFLTSPGVAVIGVTPELGGEVHIARATARALPAEGAYVRFRTSEAGTVAVYVEFAPRDLPGITQRAPFVCLATVTGEMHG